MRAFLDELGRIVVPKHQFGDGEPVAELSQQLAQSDSAAREMPMAVTIFLSAKNRCVANGQQIDRVVDFDVGPSWQGGKRISVPFIHRILRAPKHIVPWQRMGRPSPIVPSQCDLALVASAQMFDVVFEWILGLPATLAR